MYQPGFGTNQQLTQDRYEEFLDEAAQERVNQKTPTSGSLALKLSAAFAALVAIGAAIMWMRLVG